MAVWQASLANKAAKAEEMVKVMAADDLGIYTSAPSSEYAICE
jgi:hypothetical protein